jgi:hypothetical protein
MMLMWLYFGACLLIVVPLMAAYVAARRCEAGSRRGHGNALQWLAQACVLLLLPLIPYGIVESRTMLSARGLMPAVRSALAEVYSEPNVATLKVLSCTDLRAEVYVVTPEPPVEGQTGFEGEVITLHKRGGVWTFNGDYRTVWSDSGSADGNIFPPYPAKGDYPASSRL